MNTRSIYTAICESLNSEGKLPQHWTPAIKDTSPNELHFMPGAKDGISIFHFGIQQPKMAVKKIVKLLKKDWENSSPGSQMKIAELLHKHGSLSVVDPILNTIRNDHNGVDVQNMLEYACLLAFQADDEELVKIGIGLFGLLDLSNEQEIIDKLLILALYEELTLYVIVAVSNYKNGNDILFKIAQKADGWGKIHTVERLEPASDEIRAWILCSGCANEVMDVYLGLECARKGNLISALRQESLESELFDSISIIINALLDEGPADGISVYEHAEEALQRYMLFASDHAVTVKHLWYILNIQNWLENAEISNKDELRKMCSNIVCRTSWHRIICEILSNPDEEQFFHASNAASRLNMDVSEPIYKAIKQSPVKRSGYLSNVYQIPEYAKQLTKIYEEILPLEEMATGMGDITFAADHYEEHNCLDFVLQELEKYPGMGEILVESALRSPVVRERNGACKVIDSWSKILNQNLLVISPNLFTVLKNIVKVEVNPETKKSMKKMLRT